MKMGRCGTVLSLLMSTAVGCMGGRFGPRYGNAERVPDSVLAQSTATAKSPMPTLPEPMRIEIEPDATAPSPTSPPTPPPRESILRSQPEDKINEAPPTKALPPSLEVVPTTQRWKPPAVTPNPGPDLSAIASIQPVLDELEGMNPSKTEEFLSQVRTASAHGRVADVVATWQATLAYERRARSVRPTKSVPDSPRPRSNASDPYSLPEKLSPSVPLPSNKEVQPASLRPGEHAAIPHAVASPGRTEGTERISWVGEPSANTAAPAILAKADNPLSPGTSSSMDRLEDQLKVLARVAATNLSDDPATQLRAQVYNRMLHLMAGEHDRALEPIRNADPIDRDYWRNQLWAWRQYFDDRGIIRPEARAQACIDSMADAIRALEPRTDLEISTPILCREVLNFGNYEEFETYQFAPGQPLVVYWEVRNFVSVETKDGFRTRMEATFEIFDALGNRSHQFQRPFGDDLCRNRRHDYFSAVVFALPKDLRPGDYILKVAVKDLNSGRVAERQRRFAVTADTSERSARPRENSTQQDRTR